MKRLSFFLLAATAACAFAQASPQADSVLVDNARVRSSTPVYSDVQVPRTECTTQTVVAQSSAPAHQPNLVGAGLGAVAGGLLGHTVGGGNGKTAATAVGAVAGALVGNEVANRNANAQGARTPAEVQNCTTVKETQTRLVGYRVRYEWSGREFESMVRGEPGKMLAVRVSVTPVDARQP
jgi:uncharacterized protein YcfJ